MPTKILHIAEAAGGVAKFIKMFIENFPSNYEHVLITSGQYNADDIPTRNLEKHILIPMKHNISFSDFKAIINIRIKIKEEKPDLIFCHSTKAGFLGRLANKNKKTPLIYNAHGFAFNMKVGKAKIFIYKMMEKILAFKTNKIVCISKYEYESALKNKICNSNKLELIYNGVDYIKIEQIKKNFKLSKENIGYKKENIVVGQVGRLCEQKGTDIFIEVAKRLYDKNNNYRFILVGDGPIRDEIEDKIKSYNLSNCFYLTGWVNNPLEYANTFDIACLFSRWEGFGYAIEEYKALNKPIVASNVDAISELLDKTYDLDIDELVRAVLNTSLNIKQIAYSNKFTLIDCINNYDNLIKRILCSD